MAVGSMIIREETERDLLAIGALNQKAFGGDYEAQLIDKLRAAHLIVASIVALDGNELIGHLLFSSLAVEIDGRNVNAVALAPVAVSPARQRQEIGSKLIVEGLALLKKKQV